MQPLKVRAVGQYLVTHDNTLLDWRRRPAREGACKLVDAASFRMLERIEAAPYGGEGEGSDRPIEYYADAFRVYHDQDGGLLSVLEGARPTDAFEVIDARHELVRVGKRFYEGTELLDHDPRKEVALGGHFTRVKNVVYHQRRAIGAEARSFRVLDSTLAPSLGVDAHTVWFGGTATRGADASTFELLKGNWKHDTGIVFARDARRAYASSTFNRYMTKLVPFSPKRLEALVVLDERQDAPVASDGVQRYTLDRRRVRIEPDVRTPVPAPAIPHLFYGDSPAAEPCFRSLFWFSGDAPSLQKVLQTVATWFFERETNQPGAIQFQSNGKAFRGPEKKKRALLEAWLARPTTGRTRFFIMPAGASDLPFLQVHCTTSVVAIEVCLPFDTPDLVTAADALATMCTQREVLCGVQGMGFLLPPQLESCAAMLPAAGADYRCAITVRLEDAIECVRREGSSWLEELQGVEPGIADVGWRTVVGAPFVSRLKVPARLPGVAITKRPTSVTFTAGEAPRWGERKKREDLSAYAAVAACVEPVLVPFEVAARSYFSGDFDDRRGMKALRAYRRRYG
ncbi:MAG: hypothetical protein MUC96_19905 [Myxococcaceae bacterium]|jgi:hypothetical protein|nr:hypothetical protein [Myxococcaceae bacterium]